MAKIIDIILMYVIIYYFRINNLELLINIKREIISFISLYKILKLIKFVTELPINSYLKISKPDKCKFNLC